MNNVLNIPENTGEFQNKYIVWREIPPTLSHQEMREEELEYLLDPLNHKREIWSVCKTVEEDLFYWTPGTWVPYFDMKV